MKRLLTALGLLLTSVPAGAIVLVVHPDGTGDYPTIQAAIDAAAAGDIVELTAGTFAGSGNRDLDFSGKAITVRSASGDPETCLLDCGGSAAAPHRGFHFHSGETATAEIVGITVINGYIPAEPWGGAMLCELGASPTIRACRFQGNRDCALVCLAGAGATLVDCAFLQNYGTYHGAIHANAATLVITRCLFIENHTNGRGGALYNYGTTATLNECIFTGNTAGGAGAVELILSNDCTVADCLFEGNSAEHDGALYVFFTIASIERCTFAGNTAAASAAALGTGKSSHATLRNCTFWNNAAPWGSLLLSDGGTVLQNCIITANPVGPSMYIDGPADLSCCDIWGNSGGDWVPGIAPQYGVNGNIAEDPQLCDPENGDFTLRESSPCAPFTPPNPECDLIGAWPVGCGGTPIAPISWGGVKALFRE